MKGSDCCKSKVTIREQKGMMIELGTRRVSRGTGNVLFSGRWSLQGESP